MGKDASGPSVSTRVARRPLTEFVAPPVRSPVVELPRPKRPVEPDAEPEAQPQAAEAPTVIPQPQQDVSIEAVATAEQSTQVREAAERSHGGWLGATMAIASVAAKAAADYRSWLTEQMESVVSGAFGYASGLASVRVRADDPAADTAATACSRAFEAMSANWTATLDYARRLADVTSPADLILLSTSQARRQVDLLMEQSAALNALFRSIVTTHTKTDTKTDAA
jgi:hypothetical protein